MVSSEDIIRILCEWELKNNQIDALPSKLCLLAAAISILLMGILALLVILLFMLRSQKDQFEKQLKEVKSLLPEKKPNNESNLEFLNISNDHRNSPEELHQYPDESGSAPLWPKALNAQEAEPDLTAEAMKLWSGETSKVEWKYAAYNEKEIADVYVKAKNNSEAYRNYPLISQNSADEAFFMYAFDQESGKLFPKKAERMSYFWTKVNRKRIGLIFELEVDGKTVWSAGDPDTDGIFNKLSKDNTKPSRFEPAIVKKAGDHLTVVQKGKIIV